MKTVIATLAFLLLLTAAAAVSGQKIAQAAKGVPHIFCHDEIICTPVYGCRWVTICK